MDVFDNSLYQEDIAYVAESEFPWWKLKNRSVLISGASGLIGSAFIDVLMYRNSKHDMCCKIYALGRDKGKAEKRFSYCWNSEWFEFIPWDINQPFDREDIGAVDYVFHLASNTHPVVYATDPIGTITTNIIGTNHMLTFAAGHGSVRVVFASSNEIYGENRGDTEKFDEDYCGYINCNTMRAGYPESKRCGEALCQAYIKSRKMDVVIARFTRSYGPTMQMSDTKAVSQFIQKGLAKEDIVLKSAGTQYYSYTYVSDAVSGLLTILFYGKCGEAYNIADDASDIMLKDLAAVVAELTNQKVVFELPDEIESAGYSKATKARLDSSKLKKLGWKARYGIREGMFRTVRILEEKEQQKV